MTSRNAEDDHEEALAHPEILVAILYLPPERSWTHADGGASVAASCDAARAADARSRRKATLMRPIAEARRTIGRGIDERARVRGDQM